MKHLAIVLIASAALGACANDPTIDQRRVAWHDQCRHLGFTDPDRLADCRLQKEMAFIGVQTAFNDRMAKASADGARWGSQVGRQFFEPQVPAQQPSQSYTAMPMGNGQYWIQGF